MIPKIPTRQPQIKPALTPKQQQFLSRPEIQLLVSRLDCQVMPSSDFQRNMKIKAKIQEMYDRLTNVLSLPVVKRSTYNEEQIAFHGNRPWIYPLTRCIFSLILALTIILQARGSAPGAYMRPGLSRSRKSDCLHRGGLDPHPSFFKFPNQFPYRDGSKTDSQTKDYSVSSTDIMDDPYNVWENGYTSCATLHNLQLYNKTSASVTKSAVIHILSTFHNIPILGKSLDMGDNPGIDFYLQQRCILWVEPLRPGTSDIRVSGYKTLGY